MQMGDNGTDGDGGRVLAVVDDDPVFCEFVRAVAENVDCTVVEADSGVRYLENPAALAADVLVLDVVMPEMHGIELFDILAQQGRSKLILVTGYGQNFLDSALKMAADKGIGVVGGLCKPVHLKDFEGLLHTAFGEGPGV